MSRLTGASGESYEALLVISLLPVDTVPLLSRDLRRSFGERGRNYSSRILLFGLPKCTLCEETEEPPVFMPGIFLSREVVGKNFRIHKAERVCACE